MSAIDDLIKARADPSEGAITGSANSIEFAIRHRRIAGEFETPEDTAFFVLAAQKVPLLAAERDAERKAWTRYARALVDDRDAQFAEEQEQPGAEEWRARTSADLTKAEQALIDLGIDAKGILEDR